MPSSGFYPVVAVAFHGNEVAILYFSDKPYMIDPLCRRTVYTENIGLTYPADCCFTGSSFAVSPDRREKCGTPRVSGFGQSCLSVAPGDESGTPSIASAQMGVAEVFLHTLAVVVAGGFFYTDFPFGDP